MKQESFIKRIIQNPVVQSFVLYISGAWIVLEITEYLIQNFGLIENVRNVLLIVLLSAMPVVLFLSWHLARKQKREENTGHQESKLEEAPLPEDKVLKILYLLKRPKIYLPLLLLLIAIVTSSVFRIRHNAAIRWARQEVIPGIFQAIEDMEYARAFRLAQEASEHISSDSVLEKLWPRSSYHLTIRSDPSGARVYWKEIESQDENWFFLGETPLDSIWFPRTWCRIRLEKEGFETVFTANYTSFQNVNMLTEEETPTGMVYVPPGTYDIRIPGLEHLGPVELDGYWIDRCEVTNRQFKEFMDAGGYEDSVYWKHEIVKAGISVKWEEAMREFVDATGIQGPATWELGEYPEGKGDYPVTGISWYEAEAYATFRQKDLPTVFHWNVAASPKWSSVIIPHSNYAGTGPVPVGTYKGTGMFGTLDMAGNAREWCWNEGRNQRFIMGGGWNDPNYSFQDGFTQPPFNRYETNGFRCIKYIGSRSETQLMREPIDFPFRDFLSEQPVSSEILKLYRKMFEYDKGDLEPSIVSVKETESGYTKEEVSFNAAYDNERITAFLLLPKEGDPPYQVVVYYPGSGSMFSRSNEYMEFAYIDFVVKSGRALLFPVYKSTYERGDGLASDLAESTNNYKNHVIMWSNDLGRSIDYLETRKDIDIDKIAYFGYSWGGALGPLLVALEPRIRTCILHVGGLMFQRSYPEVDPFNYLSEVTIPVLMLNGRYDHFFPYETSQLPLFQLLGTAPENKQHIVFEAGHLVPRNQLVKETFEWLDRYLGPVQ